MTSALRLDPTRTEMLTYRALISEHLRTRLVNRIAREHDLERPLAERIMDQSLAFLNLCAKTPGQAFTPSTMVDIGWHTFILYTREYADFCHRTAGRFIHHEPMDSSNDPEDGANIDKTVLALKASGMWVDDLLWLSNSSDRPCEAHECRTHYYEPPHTSERSNNS
jgi:hypothetical protein